MLDRLIPIAGVVIVAAAALASLAPDGSEAVIDASAIAASDGDSRATNLASNRSSKKVGTVWDKASGHTLPRQRDGHFYANARIDGRNVHMMVDTGASVIALTGQDARSIGLSWNIADVRPIARGASGNVYGVRTQLKQVEIGGMTRRNVTAMIVPQGLDVSLLGQSYLSQIGSVQISGNEMVLSDQ